MDTTTVNNRMGIGIIARGREGFVIGGMVRYKEEWLPAEWAELEALREGIKWVSENNFTQVIFESDCASLVNRISRNSEDVTILGYRIREAKSLLNSFAETKIIWVHRNYNWVVDALSRIAIEKHLSFSFNMDYPHDIHDFIFIICSSCQ